MTSFVLGLLHEDSETAQVIFEIVDTPARKGGRVLVFMAVAGGVAATTHGAGARVDSVLQTLRVNVVAELLHIAEGGWILLNGSVCVSIPLPMSIDVDEGVSQFAEAGGDQSVGCSANVGFGDPCTVAVPRTPAHDWGGGERKGCRGGILGNALRVARRRGRTTAYLRISGFICVPSRMGN